MEPCIKQLHDNHTRMKTAKELLISLAREGFLVHVTQAIRHHHGKDVNAAVSLHLPPRIEAEKLVINLCWSTNNVNLIVDSATTKKCSLLSKDAKALVCGDIAPLQKPGHTSDLCQTIAGIKAE